MLICLQFSFLYAQYDTIDVEGIKRTYKIAVPDSYTGTDSVALVIGLHHLGSNGSQFETMTGFSILGSQENFIAAYPNGLGGSWNGGGCCNPAADDNVDDVGFISTLIDSLTLSYNIDTQRIFIAGFSNGSIMSYRLANELSEKITAVGCVAGQSFQDAINPSSVVPIIHFHALDDNAVNFEGGTNGTYTYESVINVINIWKGFNSCENDSIIIRNEDGITGYLWPSPDSLSNIMLYTSETGGHNWNMNNRLGVTMLMWDFFNSGYTIVLPVYDTLLYDGQNRSYKTHLPDQYYTEVSNEVKYPLILAFHGWYQDTDMMEEYTIMNDKADEESFIVSYLNYVGPPPDTSWNYFMHEEKPDDIGFAAKILDTLISVYPVDTARIYAIGFSDGCGMADRLPFALPGRIKGIGTVSGMIAFDDTVDTYKVPLIHINYTGDGSWADIQSRIPYWTELNGCNETADTTVNAQTIVGRRWENPDGKNHVVVITKGGGSHSWVSSEYLKATDMIWEFFETGNAIPDVDTPAVSLTPINYEKGFVVYPNPASDVITVNFKHIDKGHINLELLDLNGRVILREEYFEEELANIQLPVMAEGFYYIRTITGYNIYSEKLLIHQRK